MLALSLMWTFRAFACGGIDIGRTESLWLSRADSPFWFWIWMALYIFSIAMWATFAVLFLFIFPLSG